MFVFKHVGITIIAYLVSNLVKWITTVLFTRLFLRLTFSLGSLESPQRCVRGALPLWRWRGCKAPCKSRPPIFSAAVTQWPFIFADCLCCHPKTPHFLCEMWALRSLSPKDPLFFAFGCHRKLLFVSISSTNWSFLPFSTIFFKFLLLRGYNWMPLAHRS